MTHQGHQQWRKDAEPARDTTRIEAFSDAVIAIMLTLLAVELLEFDVEKARIHGLVAVLLQMWPSFFAFLLTFLVLGQVWMTHHNLWRYIVRVDQGLAFLNLMLLLCIAVTPLTAQILADGMVALRPPDRALAAALYSATMLAQALMFNGLLWWARRRELLDQRMSDRLFRAIERRFLAGPALYATALGLAFVSPLLGLGCYLGVIILYLWPGPGDLPPGPEAAPALP